jgi:magnesium-transporting ATPase (P-type)
MIVLKIFKYLLIVVVCYAGRDTKLMQNSGTPKFKRTKIDHWLNKIILGVNYFIFIILFLVDFCLFIFNLYDIGNLLWILGIQCWL